MKKYLSNLFTILVSGALIACTVFVTAFGNTDNGLPTVEEQTTPKDSIQKINEEIPVSKMNVNRVFDKYASGSGKGSKDSKPAATQGGSSTTGAASATASVSGTSGSSAESTKKATTTTTVKIPADESKNIEYIKDPNYQSPYYIVVYTGSQSAVVYGKDKTGAYNMLIKAFTVSTGRKSCPTRKGVYKIRAKYRWRSLNGDCFGQWCSSISPDYLFHSVPYARRSVDSLYNGSYNKLGKPASHGCIRMCVRDVKWIYDNCPIGTQVHVVWESGPKGAGVPRRKNGSKYSGWDPSDQWAPGNPYFKGQETTESEANTTGIKAPTTTKSTTKSTVKETTSTSSTTESTVSTKKAVSATTASTTVSTTASSKAAASTSTSKSTVKSQPTKPTAEDPSSEDVAVG